MRKFNSITFIAIIGLVGLITISVSFIVPVSVASSTNSEYETDEQQESDNFVETVKMTTNLFADAKIAREKQVPILLLFTQQSCGFCEIVRSDFLRPMLLNREYDSRVLIRQIEFDGDDVINFDGNKVSMDSFMEPYNVGFTPTVIFLDNTGVELTEQIIGITTVHYYGGFLDDNIDMALKKIRSNKNVVAVK
ncbi:MAG: thioredoxin family protein [Thiohalomonadales bacterium]